MENFCHLLKIPCHIPRRANPSEGPSSAEQDSACEDTRAGQPKESYISLHEIPDESVGVRGRTQKTLEPVGWEREGQRGR